MTVPMSSYVWRSSGPSYATPTTLHAMPLGAHATMHDIDLHACWRSRWNHTSYGLGGVAVVAVVSCRVAMQGLGVDGLPLLVHPRQQAVRMR